MSWPVGVTTRTVTFSSAVGTEDGAVYPARAIVRTTSLIIHLDTGVPLLPVGEIFTAGFNIPVTDQTLTYGDGYGLVYDTSNGGHTHTYHIDIEYLIEGVWRSGRRLENVVVPTSGTAFDLDLAIADGFVSAPIKVLIPDVWSPSTVPGDFDPQSLEEFGIFFPESYGAQGYPNNDVPAWNACQDAVIARGGGVVWASRQYGGSGVAYHRGGVTVRGMGNPRVEIPDFEGEVGFKALDGTFQYLYGMYTSPDGHSRDNNPGPLENFFIDGDFLAEPAGGLARCEASGSTWYKVCVRRAKGDGLVLPGTQNMIFYNCEVGEMFEINTTGCLLTTTTFTVEGDPNVYAGQGVGGCKWYGGHIGDSWRPYWATAPAGAIAVLPHHDNIFDGVLFETGRTLDKGILCNVQLDYGETTFKHVVFTIGANVEYITEGCNLLIDNPINSGYSTIAILENCWMGGGSDDADPVEPTPGVAVYATYNIKVRQVAAYNEVRVIGGIQVANSDYFLCVDGVHLGTADMVGDLNGFLRKTAGGAALGVFKGINGGTYTGLVGERYTPVRYLVPAIQPGDPGVAGEADLAKMGNPIQIRVIGKAANSFQVDGKGVARWPNPNTGAIAANITPDYTNAVMALQGRWFIQDGFGKTAGFQIISASAAVTIDVAANPAFIISFTSNGNGATSVTLTNTIYGVGSAFTEGAEVLICLLSSVNVAFVTWGATPITWLRAEGGPQPVLNKAVYVRLRYEGGTWREVHGKPRINQLEENRPTTGMEVYPRTIATTATVGPPTGQMYLTYFKAYKSFTSTAIRMFTTNNAAAATPTLVRIGLYSVAANGDLTLIASTPNDTAMFNASNSVFTKNWSVAVDIVEDQRYAVGVLIVTGAAVPTLACVLPVLSVSDEDPRLTGRVISLADLPGSVTTASGLILAINTRFYSILR